jgi:hypothetical protein
MFTPRDRFIIAVINELHNKVSDTCDCLLDDDFKEAKSSVASLLGSVQRLHSLIKEDDETEI